LFLFKRLFVISSSQQIRRTWKSRGRSQPSSWY